MIIIEQENALCVSYWNLTLAQNINASELMDVLLMSDRKGDSWMWPKNSIQTHQGNKCFYFFHYMYLRKKKIKKQEQNNWSWEANSPSSLASQWFIFSEVCDSRSISINSVSFSFFFFFVDSACASWWLRFLVTCIVGSTAEWQFK